MQLATQRRQRRRHQRTPVTLGVAGQIDTLEQTATALIGAGHALPVGIAAHQQVDAVGGEVLALLTTQPAGT